MFVAISKDNRLEQIELLREMHRERKRVFVDMLRWKVPVLDGQYEMDEFDDDEAVYLVACDRADGRHLASMRLLRTDRPHILGDLFPELCNGPVPRGPTIREVTRLCMSPRLTRMQRLELRARLACGLVDYALLTGITSVTAVADLAWLNQLLAAGWDCNPLGIPQSYDGSILGALRIDFTADTRRQLREHGLHAPQSLELVPAPANALAA